MMKDYDEDTAAAVDNYDDVYDFAAVYCNGYDADDAAENGNKINKDKFNDTDKKTATVLERTCQRKEKLATSVRQTDNT